MRIWTPTGEREVKKNETWHRQCPACIADLKEFEKKNPGLKLMGPGYLPDEHDVCDEHVIKQAGLFLKTTGGCCSHDERKLYEQADVVMALRTLRHRIHQLEAK